MFDIDIVLVISVIALIITFGVYALLNANNAEDLNLYCINKSVSENDCMDECIKQFTPEYCIELVIKAREFKKDA